MVSALKSAILGMAFAYVASVGAALAQTPGKGVDDPSGWARGHRIVLGVSQPQLGFSAQWRFQRAPSGDILLDLQETRAGRVRAGSLLLVADGVLLSRDVLLDRGRELDAVSGPLLMLQLVLRLLERAAPAGPEALRREQSIDVSEPERAIKVSVLGAGGEFRAPWRLRGTMAPGADGQVRFELEFVSAARAAGAPRYETSIAGIWQSASPPLQLPDAMPLRGWRAFQIKPMTRQQGASAVGLGASAPMAFANLGAVRRQAAEWARSNASRERFQCR